MQAEQSGLRGRVRRPIEALRVEIREATWDDAVRIGLGLRESDAEETFASTGLPPVRVCVASWERSEASFVYVIDGEVVAMFGAVALPQLGEGIGGAWMLATKTAESAPLKVWRALSIHGVQLLWRLYPTLTNFVLAENTRTIRWLRWLGATLLQPVPYGHANRLFRPFFLKSADSNV